MQAWFVLLLAGSALASSASSKEEVLSMLYNEPNLDEPATMDVTINEDEETIRFHMEQQGNIADVETLEDYSTGFAASRAVLDEICYIRKIMVTMDEAVKMARKLANSGVQEYMGTEDVMAIPAEDVEEWAGERLVKFCGDYAMYKLVKPAEDESEAPVQKMSDISTVVKKDKRQTSVSFSFCYFFFFFFKCITTTITVPTGTTIVFLFFG